MDNTQIKEAATFGSKAGTYVHEDPAIKTNFDIEQLVSECLISLIQVRSNPDICEVLNTVQKALKIALTLDGRHTYHLYIIQQRLEELIKFNPSLRHRNLNTKFKNHTETRIFNSEYIVLVMQINDLSTAIIEAFNQ